MRDGGIDSKFSSALRPELSHGSDVHRSERGRYDIFCVFRCWAAVPVSSSPYSSMSRDSACPTLGICLCHTDIDNCLSKSLLACSGCSRDASCRHFVSLKYKPCRLGWEMISSWREITPHQVCSCYLASKTIEPAPLDKPRRSSRQNRSARFVSTFSVAVLVLEKAPSTQSWLEVEKLSSSRRHRCLNFTCRCSGLLFLPCNPNTSTADSRFETSKFGVGVRSFLGFSFRLTGVTFFASPLLLNKTSPHRFGLASATDLNALRWACWPRWQNSHENHKGDFVSFCPETVAMMVVYRFGPVLADSAGNFNFLPISSRDELAKDPAALSMQGDDVSELGSTASCASWDHSIHGNRHAQRHRGLPRQQRQVDGKDSDRSCGASVNTIQSERRGGETFPFCETISSERSIVMSERTDRHNHRRERQNRRHGSSCKSGPITPAVESIHFEGHLLHRVCGVTGKFPAHGDGGGGTNGNFEDDNDSDESSLLEDSGENQLVRLRRNPRMMEIISELKALSISLINRDGRGTTDPGSSNQSEDQHQQQDRKVQVAFGGRRIKAIRVAQQEYLRLFEEMLGELLKIQREKSKVIVRDPSAPAVSQLASPMIIFNLM